MKERAMRASGIGGAGGAGARAALIVLLLLAPALRAQTPASVEAPRGWFGVTISDEATLDERGRAFFDGYPVVSKVEPGSPAAKAGIAPGDVLMTFNSQDMRGAAFELRKWLRPGAPFELRLKRNDIVRVVRGTLSKPPEGWEDRTVVALSTPETFELRTRTPARPSFPSAERVAIIRRGAGGEGGSLLPTRVPTVMVPAFTGVYPFAGADFTELNDDLSDVLGVQTEGVFVTSVMEGSPARRSGLRGGDVILRADGIKCDNPVDLARAIREAEDRTIRLEIVRKRKPQTLTLRW